MTYFDSSTVMKNLAALTGVRNGESWLNTTYLSNQPKMVCPKIPWECQPQNLFKIISFRGLESFFLKF